MAGGSSRGRVGKECTISGASYYATIILIYFGTDLISAWGFNLEFGVTGLPNFAWIMMVAGGAYTYGVLTLGPDTKLGGFQKYVIGLHLPPVAAIIIATLVGGAIGVILGLTGLKRLRPDYQALTLLIVSITAGVVVGADVGFLNGVPGLSLIPNPLASVSGGAENWVYVGVVAVLCLLSFWILRRFTEGPMGRMLRAVRDNEEAALAIGKSVVGTRLIVQVFGGMLAGLSGALLVGFIGAWAPGSWTYVETFSLLTAIIVGGRGSNLGTLVGTALIPILVLQGMQYLPNIPGPVGLTNDLGWVFLGVVTVGFLWFRPAGLLPEKRPVDRLVPAGGNGRRLFIGRQLGDGHGAAGERAVEAAQGASNGSLTEPGQKSGAIRIQTRKRPEVAVAQRDILSVDGLVRRYGGVRAVDGASFSVERGAITGLIGPNGAGKSTVLGMISGFIQPNQGRVVFQGVDITKASPQARARSGLVTTFQLPHEFGGLTTIENLLVAIPHQRGESLRSVALGTRYWRRQEEEARERARSVLSVFGMLESRNVLARNLSGGQKRMLEVMRALMLEPDLLLLDEPLAGLSPALSEQFEAVCAELRSRGLSMLLIEHELGAVERLCDRVVVMAMGKVLSEGRMSELRMSKEVQDAYLAG